MRQAMLSLKKKRDKCLLRQGEKKRCIRIIVEVREKLKALQHDLYLAKIEETTATERLNRVNCSVWKVAMLGNRQAPGNVSAPKQDKRR